MSTERTFWDSERMTMTEAIDRTVLSVNAFAGGHRHWPLIAAHLTQRADVAHVMREAA